METKRQIRQRILTVRSKLSEKEWQQKSLKIVNKVMETKIFQKSDVILAYLDYNKEVNTRYLIQQAWKLGKKVYVPKVNGDTMSFHLVYDFEELVSGFRGILEPLGTNEEWTNSLLQTSLMIMPGVAFDKERHRIGYGKGYYDRFLSNQMNLQDNSLVMHHQLLSTIAICFDCQLLEAIPYEEFDYKPDIIYTESLIL